MRLTDRREVAIKVVLPGVEGATERALREFSILQRVAPEHLVPFVETVDLGDELAVVLGRVDGGTLGRVLTERGWLSDGEAVTAVSPIATALGHLHEAGIVHGDVSPDNVLFDRSGRPALADLGLARLLGEHQPADFATPGFVAPELLSGGAPSPAADVYALGALLWFALCGEPPGIGGTRRALEEVAPRAGQGIVEVAKRLIASDPRERPTAREAAALVFDAAVPEPIAIVSGPSEVTGLTRRLREQARDLDDLGIPELAPLPEPEQSRGRSRARAVASRWSRPRHGAGGRTDGLPARAGALARFGVMGAAALVVGIAVSLALLWGLGSRGDSEAAAAAGARPLATEGAPARADETAGATSTGEAGATPSAAAASETSTEGAGATSSPTETPAQGDGMTSPVDVRLERDAPRSSPSRLLQALADARAEAWERGDVQLLAEAVARGSSAWRADEQQISRLASQRARLEGVELSVRQAGLSVGGRPAGRSTPDAVADQTAGSEVVMSALVRTGEHDVVFSDGRRATRPARDGAPVRITLTWTADGWRISAVTPRSEP
ncbi:MAG: serine/threonine protein kinase [Micrococcales bacterium]|nr:serine/threonine protein kinase [Micrococcales bacterium]